MTSTIHWKTTWSKWRVWRSSMPTSSDNLSSPFTQTQLKRSRTSRKRWKMIKSIRSNWPKKPFTSTINYSDKRRHLAQAWITASYPQAYQVTVRSQQLRCLLSPTCSLGDTVWDRTFQPVLQCWRTASSNRYWSRQKRSLSTTSLRIQVKVLRNRALYNLQTPN